MPYTLRIMPAGSADATLLIAGLDADLNARYPGEEVNGIDAVEFESNGGTFVVGYLNDVPVACGALRPFEDAIEVKRMFVVADQRGRGLARQLLKFLGRRRAQTRLQTCDSRDRQRPTRSDRALRSDGLETHRELR